MNASNDEWIQDIETLSEKHLSRLRQDLKDELTQISVFEKENRSQFLNLQDIYHEWNEIKLNIHKVVQDNIINKNKLEVDKEESENENEINEASRENNDETELINYNTLTKKASDLKISPLIFSRTFHLAKRSSWNPSTAESDTGFSTPTYSSSLNESLDSVYSSETTDETNKRLPATPKKFRYTPSKSGNSSPIKNNFRFFKVVDTKKDDLNYSFSYNTFDSTKESEKKLMKDLKLKLLKKQPYVNRNFDSLDLNMSKNLNSASSEERNNILNAVSHMNSTSNEADNDNDNSHITNTSTRNSFKSPIWFFLENDSKISVTDKEKIVIIISFLIGILTVIIYQLM